MVPLYLDGTYGRVSHDILFDNQLLQRNNVGIDLGVSIPLKYTTTIFSSHRSHSNTEVLNCHSSSLPQWFETVIHLSQTLQAIQGKDLDEHFNYQYYVVCTLLYKRKQDR